VVFIENVAYCIPFCIREFFSTLCGDLLISLARLQIDDGIVLFVNNTRTIACGCACIGALFENEGDIGVAFFLYIFYLLEPGSRLFDTWQIQVLRLHLVCY
jgi:hypothetical protein